MKGKLTIIVHDTVPGRLPRIPKDEWESKRRPAETITCSIDEWTPKGMVKGKSSKITMPAKLWLEDILIWCECKHQEHGNYIEEEDGTHGVVCANCGGVIQLG